MTGTAHVVRQNSSTNILGEESRETTTTTTNAAAVFLSSFKGPVWRMKSWGVNELHELTTLLLLLTTFCKILIVA